MCGCRIIKEDMLGTDMLKKFSGPLQGNRVIDAIAKLARSPFKSLRKQRRLEALKAALSIAELEDRFSAIHQNNLWGNSESASGPGSSLRYTENLRRELPELFRKFAIKEIFDAPCGDFHWMRHLLPNVDVQYIGGDIVSSLIEANQRFKNDKVSFVHIDLTKDILPRADLMICRDLLFHLSYVDTISVLENFTRSNIAYLLTTTHNNTGGFLNVDIQSGSFRRIDLFSRPYCFPSGTLAAIDDWIKPHYERQMCLWSADQVSVALSALKSNLTPA